MLRRQATDKGTSLSFYFAKRCFSEGIVPPAFVFDIDGVLIRGNRVLEPAKRALKKLYNADGATPRYPVCFLTNGGGVLEEKKAAQLSGWLGVAVRSEQVVLSHTPFRHLVPRLGERPVLVSGRGQYAEVAEAYGFRRVVTVAQLARAYPSALPFSPTAESSNADVDALRGIGTAAAPIEAVLVFTDPSDWYQDLQLITDVITSGGVPGRPSSSKPEGSSPVEVFFSNPDLIWAAKFPTPRFGQGAFSVALEALVTKVAEHPVSHWRWFGKPNKEPFDLIVSMLAEEAQQIARNLGTRPPSKSLPYGPIYMVGDNPESDIAGARNAGPPWVSVLVRTGVFSGTGSNSSKHPADFVLDNVESAVDMALHRSRSQKWHSLR